MVAVFIKADEISGGVFVTTERNRMRQAAPQRSQRSRTIGWSLREEIDGQEKRKQETEKYPCHGISEPLYVALSGLPTLAVRSRLFLRCGISVSAALHIASAKPESINLRPLRIFNSTDDL